MLPRSGDIRGQSLKWSKIDRNFACFWPPIFLGGAPPEFLKSVYKIQPDSDHVQSSGRSVEGSRRKRGEKKTSRAEYKPVRNGVPGGLITSGLVAVSSRDFFQSTSSEAGVITWVQFLQGPPPEICDRQKMSKIRRDF